MINQVKYPFDVKSIQLSNGCKMAYVDEGKGPQTIVFIHGLATYSLTWKKNIDYLKRFYRCIAIDLPGNGLSGRGKYAFGIDFFAGCVYELISSLSLTNVCLAGHSMGGQIAMYLLIRQPDCASKLVLCAPAGFETFNGFERSMYKSTINMLDFFSTEENSLRQMIRTSFYHNTKVGDDISDELIKLMKSYPVSEYRSMIDKCIESMLNEPVYEDMNQIKQKTLIMYGDRDALIPNRMIHPVTTKHIAEVALKKLVNGRLKMIAQCGHFLQLEKADEVNGYIREFIQE